MLHNIKQNFIWDSQIANKKTKKVKISTATLLSFLSINNKNSFYR